ncbi:2,3-diaminopropionate biosynthesis protein SbnB [Pseudobacillus wudalianchiensis]|uniref:2,3-diaminopropionate biosynthesis protein SbnB n=1 Tax=Pseudobacillus wudalianchiensis TaxID=1743143 RepID=A0A1B9AMG5_9BACI|nr:2,3-diaminopropionate biosynthesis protein SbnB [Bacillus wudalianchiensis]OCA84976.1 2,3-diaminopropionate biosynthesis protein SbnB [Bacillus wudalianchiensis]
MKLETKTNIKTTEQQEVPSLLYLSKKDIIKAGGGQSDLYVEALTGAFRLHGKKDFVQPLKPYLRANGKQGHIADRIIAMPAYVGGEDPISGIKWIGSKHDNPTARGLERASGLIILNDPDTNFPISAMEASLISSMRTAAVTVIATKHLAKKEFQAVSIIGCGLIASKQAQSLLEQFTQIKEVHLFDLNHQAAVQFAAGWEEHYPSVQFMIHATAESAIRQGEVIVPCTVTDQPYIEYSWLQKGAFVCNISIMDVKKDVFLQADKVLVDDWEQANREKKVIHQLVTEGKFSKEQLYAELGEVVLGEKAGREQEEEIIILNPMGMALEDVASAYAIYKRAVEQQIGTELSLY